MTAILCASNTVRVFVQGVKLDDGRTLADLQLQDGEFLVAVETRKKAGTNGLAAALAAEPTPKPASTQACVWQGLLPVLPD